MERRYYNSRPVVVAPPHRSGRGPSPAWARNAPSLVQSVLSAPGQSLDGGTRAVMESRFDHDFSQVRVHTDAKAAASARAVNALAYTVGQDVVFGAGGEAMATNTGRRLLAHELTHVVQQTRAGGCGWASEETAEREADTNSAHIAAGREGRVRSRAASGELQRADGVSGSATFGDTTEEKKDEVKTSTEANLELKVPVLPNGTFGPISLLKDAKLKLKLADKETSLKPGESTFDTQLDLGLGLAQLELFKRSVGGGSLSSDLKLGASAAASSSSPGAAKGSLGSTLDFTALKYTLPKVQNRFGTFGGDLSLSGSGKGTLPTEGEPTAGVGAKLGGNLEYTSPQLRYEPYGPSRPPSYGQIKLGASGSLSADTDTAGKSKLGAGVGFSAGYDWQKLGPVQPFVLVKVDLKWSQSGDKVESSQVGSVAIGGRF